MEQPEWLARAWDELGQREIAGSADNARIRAFFRDVGHGAVLRDEVAWCAAFVGACLERAGHASTRSLMARSYLRWGERVDEGQLGAIAVLSRGSNPSLGHVGFLVGETSRHVLLLGGNQGDAVSVVAYPKTRLLGLRWPQVTTKDDAADDDTALFEAALVHVLKMEGGFSDDAHDPGGPTNRGITLKVFAAWKGITLTSTNRSRLVSELRAIPDAAVREIYRTRYWRPAHCAEMAQALALFHFDAAVNHGVTGAMRLLQRAAGTPADGEIGPNTRAAIARYSTHELLQRYAQVRRERYRTLPHFWRFGRGWLRRVDSTLAAAEALHIGAASVDTTQTDPASRKEPQAMSDVETRETNPKWWGQSITIWGAIITGLSTVLPALGPAFGIDVTGDLVREAGEGIVQTVQAVGGLIGTLMTIYGRVRARAPLQARDVSLKL